MCEEFGVKGLRAFGFQVESCLHACFGSWFLWGCRLCGVNLWPHYRGSKEQALEISEGVLGCAESVWGLYHSFHSLSKLSAVLRGLEGGFWDFGFMEIQGPKELPILLWEFLIISMI